MAQLPSIEHLRSIFSYNEATGELKRIAGFGPRKTGFTDGDGYLRVNCNGRRISVHRLAWALTYGCWPVCDIDHINGDRKDNRICNLRDVPRQINLQNKKGPSARSSSGLLGVHANHGKWRAKIQVDGKSIVLGRFDSKDDAYAAYVDAKRRLHAGCTI